MSSTPHSRGPEHRRFELEQLEPRVLLSAGTVVAPLIAPPSSLYAGAIVDAQVHSPTPFSDPQSSLFGDVSKLEALGSSSDTPATSVATGTSPRAHNSNPTPANSETPSPTSAPVLYGSAADDPTISLSGGVAYLAQGPFGTTGAQVSGMDAQGNPTAGAVRAFLVDPNNPDIAYVAGVNGGIWKTTNLNATTVVNGSTVPATTWVPLTDQYATLAISSLAFDPSNSNVIYAGTGSTSSSGSGGPGLGILQSSDGGETWTLIGGDTIGGAPITKVVPTQTESYPSTAPFLTAGSLNGTKAGVKIQPNADNNDLRVDALRTSDEFNGYTLSLQPDPSNTTGVPAAVWNAGTKTLTMSYQAGATTAKQAMDVANATSGFKELFLVSLDKSAETTNNGQGTLGASSASGRTAGGADQTLGARASVNLESSGGNNDLMIDAINRGNAGNFATVILTTAAPSRMACRPRPGTQAYEL
ncbi:MAG: LEPR-XLL domain-containing protein [Limisphaerales bacterium]